MTHKTFAKTAGTIFLIVALLHLLRIIGGWPITLGSTIIPLWVSWIGLAVGGYLSFQGLKQK